MNHLIFIKKSPNSTFRIILVIKRRSLKGIKVKPKLLKRKKSSDRFLLKALSDNVVALEATLFRQASLQCKRLARLSKVLDDLEERIFDQNLIESLPYEHQLAIYKEARKSQQFILNYLQSLHNMTLDSKEILSLLKQYQEQLSNENSEESDSELNRLRYLLAKVIKQKRDEQA